MMVAGSGYILNNEIKQVLHKKNVIAIIGMVYARFFCQLLKKISIFFKIISDKFVFLYSLSSLLGFEVVMTLETGNFLPAILAGF